MLLLRETVSFSSVSLVKEIVEVGEIPQVIANMPLLLTAESWLSFSALIIAVLLSGRGIVSTACFFARIIGFSIPVRPISPQSIQISS